MTILDKLLKSDYFSQKLTFSLHATHWQNLESRENGKDQKTLLSVQRL